MKNYELKENKLIVYGIEPTIEKSAFAFKQKEEVELKDGIEVIGDSAFYYNGLKQVIFPNTLKIIEDKAFYYNKLKELNIPGSVEYLGNCCFLQNNISGINFSNGLKIIAEMVFDSNMLEEVILPNSLIKIGKKAFNNNNIKKLILNDNLIEIGELAFAKNKITELKLPDSLEILESESFAENEIVELKLTNKLTVIGDGAFKNNKIEKIEFNENLQIIGDDSFSINKLVKLNIPEKVTKIGTSAFSFNMLEEVIFNDKLQYIGARAFANNNIKNLNLKENITYIAESAFTFNEIKNLVLPDSLKEIKFNTFSNNKIENLVLPNNLEKIERNAFNNNNISNIVLPNTLKYIGENAFTDNNITNITIPSNIENIERNAFDKDVIITIDNITLPNDFIEKFGTESIVKVAKILKICPSFKLEYINKKLLDVLSISEDSIKGFMNNSKVFDKLIEESNIPELENRDMEEYTDFYKMCHIFGLFNTGGEKQQEIINKIKEFLSVYDINQVHQLFTDIELKPYNEKLSSIILNEYDHPKLKEIIAKFYNNYSVIYKSILENRKEIIGILNSSFNKEEDLSKKEELKKQLEQLKCLRKLITIDDIIKYISEHTFIVREENDKLNNIINILSSYLNQEEFDEIQNIYEKGKKVNDKYFSNIVDRNQDGIHYYWPSKDNPINIILGYLCDCCAKYGGAGEDIMIQSIVNPNIKNLVIYDSMRNVIAKSTAFYNDEKRYLLFNNVEISHRFMNNKNTKTKDFEELYEALIRGIEDQIECMKEKGYVVENVRIGMARNDLSDTIIRRRNEVKHSDFLMNYAYANYGGDANIPEFGQAILKVKKR